MAAALNFYYNPMSVPSRSVWMVLEELGVEYIPNVINLNAGEHKSAEYKKISFRQKVPAIKEGDFVLAESRAVAGYLVSRYGDTCKKRQLYPADERKRAKIDQHLYISENTSDAIVAYVNVGGVLARGELTRTENISKAKDALAYIEEFLTQHAYAADEHLTLADFFYMSSIGLLSVTDFDCWGEYPKIAEWRQKMEALPYYKKTLGDPLAQFKKMYHSKLAENAKKQQAS